MIKSLDELVKAAQKKGGTTLAIACPEDESFMLGLKEARSKGLAESLLVGDQELITRLAKEVDFPLSEAQLFHAPSKEAAARKAVELVKTGKAKALMKGLLPTDILLKALLEKDQGLRSGKLLSHVALFQIPTYHKLLVVTDVAMNISPGLMEKKQIIENAVFLMRKLGLEKPKVAVLAAVEEVNGKMPATLEAAILAKMAERKQIKDAIVDGPLALDNAISEKAARDKGIISPVAGDADILLVPDIEAGNLLFKCLIFFAQARMAGVVMGALSPIILTSRADPVENKVYSIALGAWLS